ncbi:MAG TPA: hypothetical protein VNK95_16135, partial [Caldilineaceae bacterium]|nr:hypothetical protein [Caldilineaceae bacterium]
NPQNRYLLHAPAQTVFQGRREAFQEQAAALGLAAEPVARFSQRDGSPLFEVWQVSGQQDSQ